jgi:hypothetical protein
MPSGGKKPQYDYPTMQLEYVTGNMSLRELAAKHGVKSPSSVAAYSRRHGWDEKRVAFRATQDDAVAEAVAERRAQKIADIERDFMKTIHAAVIKMGLDLEDRWETDPKSGTRVFVKGQAVTPEGLTKLIEKFMVMSGGVSNREAHVGLDVAVGPEQLPPDVLRRLRQLAIEQGAGTETSGRSPLPGGARAKPVGAPMDRTVGD